MQLQDVLKVILGIFLIIISVLFLVRPLLRVPTNRNIVITGGGISGNTGLVETGYIWETNMLCLSRYL